MTDPLLALSEPEPTLFRTVVRLRSSAWSDGRGLHTKRSLTFMRRHSFGLNILAEESDAAGAECALGSLVNLNQCSDGLYEIVVVNQSRDWETGIVDSYDLKLVPFNPPPPAA